VASGQGWLHPTFSGVVRPQAFDYVANERLWQPRRITRRGFLRSWASMKSLRVLIVEDHRGTPDILAQSVTVAWLVKMPASRKSATGNCTSAGGAASTGRNSLWSPIDQCSLTPLLAAGHFALGTALAIQSPGLFYPERRQGQKVRPMIQTSDSEGRCESDRCPGERAIEARALSGTEAAKTRF
jgi:hypothetical protein